MGGGEQTRGKSISSQATTASSLTGGGCIPPPVPGAAKGVDPAVLNLMIQKQLVQSDVLYGKGTSGVGIPGYMTTTQYFAQSKALAEEDLARVPVGGLGKMGATVRHGGIDYKAEGRVHGEQAFWQTSTMYQNEQVFDDKALK